MRGVAIRRFFLMTVLSLQLCIAQQISGIGPIFGTVGTVQAGSWVSIYGTQLACGIYSWNGDFPTSLGGMFDPAHPAYPASTAVTIGRRPAYLSFVSPVQINAQVPDGIPKGVVTVDVDSTCGGGAPDFLAESSVIIGDYSPAFCLFDKAHPAAEIATPNGTGSYGKGTYDFLGPTGAFAFASRPAKIGETLILYGVGFGPTTPSVPAGRAYAGAATLNSQITVSIGNVNATVLFAGITSAGLYQFNVIVPNISSGEQPLRAFIGDASTPIGTTVTVQ